jgi:NAD-dependent SIR2 family protein deacetylase
MEKNNNLSNNLNYVVIQNDNSIAYKNENCYVKEEIYLNNDENKSVQGKEIAETLKKQFYKNFFSKHYKNLVILTAAGTSLSSNGKSRDGLWEKCLPSIMKIVNKIKGIEKKEFFINKDIEKLLSYIINYEKVNNVLIEDGVLLRKEIEENIADACRLSLTLQSPHKDFINKITARKNNDPRVQLFTTNYDTLFEKAAGESGFIIIDGFSFTEPRTFSGNWFDLDIVNREKTRLKQEESFISKVFHLYKLHGSLNWSKQEGNIIQDNKPSEPLIIYPADEKYESSFEQPYFEMMSRFQQALRKENTLLIIIGFSFQDKHIKNTIIEAVEQNHGFQVLILNYEPNGSGINPKFMEQFFSNYQKMKVKRGVTIVFDSFEEFTKNYPENQSYNNNKEEIEDKK